ncbi:MAG: PspC domain-containing protein [Methanolinea sp.]|nr:PspC domain-containing protein [Methanolinea sp.]
MKKLERPRKGRLLGGVCAGIGTYFDLDPVLVRILWVALTVASVGIGVIVYIAAWILMPEEEEEKTPAVSATP